MSIGQLGMEHPSLAGMIDAIKVKMSRIALHERFTPAAVDFLKKCLCFLLQQRIAQACPIETKLLQPFKRVLIVDSSSWDVSDKLRGVLPGSGGMASSANCKLQAAYEYKKGELAFLDVTPGTVPDNRYTNHLPDMVNKKDLVLMDQGYFKLKAFNGIIQKGAFFLTRFLVSTGLADPKTMVPIDLEKQLSKLQDNSCEMDVIMGSRAAAQLRCRLVCLRVSQQVADERRRRMRKQARKKGRGVSKRHLALCAWTLLVTNVPEKWLPLEMTRALYTLRWQIELLFKQLKSILRIHQSNTTKEHRLRCELYGKLIAAVLIHRIHAAVNVTLWNTQRREVSMDKLYKRIQERAFSLLGLMLHSLTKAVIYLRKEIGRVLKHCLKNHQPSRLTTLEMLDAGFDQRLDNPERVSLT